MKTQSRVVPAGGGEVLPWSVGTNRFLFESEPVALVEHRIDPHSLPGPLHRHSREDEYSFVIEGRVAALVGDEEVVAEAGDLLVKPRGEWHAFWNPADRPLRILEILVPGGLEQLFRELSGGTLDPASLPARAAAYGCDIDFERTAELVASRGLRF